MLRVSVCRRHTRPARHAWPAGIVHRKQTHGVHAIPGRCWVRFSLHALHPSPNALPFYLDPCIISKEGAYCIFDYCRNKGIVKKKSAGGETSGQNAIGGGEALHALYDYRASPDIPFPPDPRPELSMQRGDVFHLKYKRSEDGWCLVSIASHLQHQQDASDVGVEGWVRAMIPSLLSFLEQCNFC